MARMMMFAVMIMLPAMLSAQNITMRVTGLRSAKGQIIIQAFKDQQSFAGSKPYKTFKYPKKSITGGTLTIQCDLPPGSYGLALLDDENGNGVTDYNFLKMPKEGFAFSDYYLSGMSRPEFSDFKFEVKEQPVKVTMKLRYL